jgi:hypothetical protein
MIGLLLFCVGVGCFMLGVLTFALFRSKRGDELDPGHTGLFLDDEADEPEGAYDT